jgi:hypothetical protein
MEQELEILLIAAEWKQNIQANYNVVLCALAKLGISTLSLI